jgi:CelD/BcsL family acetyltransferase involved in cellulose biosynthesis
MTTAVRPDADGGGPADAAPLYETAVLRDERALGALAGEWNDLQDRSPGATPFQCHAWLSSWWHSYGRPGRLRLVTVRRDGRLIALAPLRRDGTVLRPLGGEITDFHDVLLDGEFAEEAAERLAAALAAELRGPFARLDLPEVRADAAIHTVLPHWPCAARKLQASLVQHLPGVPMEELLTRLPNRTAQRTKAKLRKLAAVGIDVRLVPRGRSRSRSTACSPCTPSSGGTAAPPRSTCAVASPPNCARLRRGWRRPSARSCASTAWTAASSHAT